MMQQSHELLDNLYNNNKINIAQKLDLIFEHVYFLVIEEKLNWAELNLILQNLDLNKINSTIAIGFITSIFPFRNDLEEYFVFVSRVEAWLSSQGKTQEQIDRLLDGLNKPTKKAQ